LIEGPQAYKVKFTIIFILLTFEIVIYQLSVKPAYRRAVYQTYNLYWKKGQPNDFIVNEKNIKSVVKLMHEKEI
jgi:hypothetical protein